MSEGGTGPPREPRRAERGFVRCVNHHVNDARATRCRICGVPIPYEEPGRLPPVDPDWWRRRWLLALLVILLLLLLILAIFLVVRGGGGSSRAAARTSPTGTPTSTVLSTSSGSPSSSSPSRSSPPPARRVLHQGDTGADVVAVQRRLAALGYGVVPDGQLGPQTMAAVLDFKKRHGLGAAPVVDLRTWQALLAPTTAPSP